MCCVNLSVVIEPREDRAAESRRLPLPFHFVPLMEKLGYTFLEDIIWLKPEGSARNRNGRFSIDRQPLQYKPNTVNEYVLVFRKPAPFLIDKTLREYQGERREKSLVASPYERSNVWSIPPERSAEHPAPFPLELCRKLVTYYSFVGDVVFDPFMGSGTTGVACIETGRLFVGSEINEAYHSAAQSRTEALMAQQRLY